ncbi:hypothetical protein FPV67DRAFT_1450663 [Lyophyllum atratum]|nr:hypothetical protein FPV67DRAFT_1450663 [Lyophyllum atratum]
MLARGSCSRRGDADGDSNLGLCWHRMQPTIPLNLLYKVFLSSGPHLGLPCGNRGAKCLELWNARRNVNEIRNGVCIMLKGALRRVYRLFIPDPDREFSDRGEMKETRTSLDGEDFPMFDANGKLIGFKRVPKAQLPAPAQTQPKFMDGTRTWNGNGNGNGNIDRERERGPGTQKAGTPVFETSFFSGMIHGMNRTAMMELSINKEAMHIAVYWRFAVGTLPPFLTGLCSFLAVDVSIKALEIFMIIHVRSDIPLIENLPTSGLVMRAIAPDFISFFVIGEFELASPQREAVQGSSSSYRMSIRPRECWTSGKSSKPLMGTGCVSTDCMFLFSFWDSGDFKVLK